MIPHIPPPPGNHYFAYVQPEAGGRPSPAIPSVPEQLQLIFPLAPEVVHRQCGRRPVQFL